VLDAKLEVAAADMAADVALGMVGGGGGVVAHELAEFGATIRAIAADGDKGATEEVGERAKGDGGDRATEEEHESG
jgi:precorrin-6B methylase 2